MLGVYCYYCRRDASPSQGYHSAVCRRYPFIHLSEERQSGVKFPFRGNNTTGKASTVTSRSRVRGVTRSATHASTISIAFITGCVKTKSLLIMYLFISKACSWAKFKTFFILRNEYWGLEQKGDFSQRRFRLSLSLRCFWR